MLVLSRKRNESLVIGASGEITVTVCEIRGDKVRLGVTAPKEIPCHRQEVWDAIHGKPKQQNFTDKAPEMVRPVLPPEPFTQR